MRVSNNIITLFAALAVAACTPVGDDQSGSTTALAGEEWVVEDIVARVLIDGEVRKTTYHCSDGSRIEAWYPTTDTVRIVDQGQSIVMTSVVSANGARYVGGGCKCGPKG